MERSMNWSIDAPAYADHNGTTTYRPVESGVVEVWHETFDDHPWKNREFRPQKIRTISQAEAVSEILALEEQIHQAAEVKTAQAKVVQDYLDYCRQLPEQLGAFRRQESEIVDSSGNYLLGVPRKAAKEFWSVEDLVAWIEEAMSCEGFGD